MHIDLNLVFCREVFSFTKRISRAQSPTWEFVESLYRPADIIACMPKISRQLTVNLVPLCRCGVSRKKNGLTYPEILCLIRAACYPGRETVSFVAPRCVSWIWHTVYFGSCGSLCTWLDSAGNTKLRVIFCFGLPGPDACKAQADVA